MDAQTIIFYILAVVIACSGIGTVIASNPIYSALNLAVTMVSLALVYIQLGAQFVGAVQLIVYAGAVMVLFVMVLMLFDMKSEHPAVSKETVSQFLKITVGGLLLGLLAGVIHLSTQSIDITPKSATTITPIETTKLLAQKIFTTYIAAFELLGFLLLCVAIGVVAIARMKGGTHGQS
jgi:NADH-quinone oxidoreductase subunit J